MPESSYLLRFLRSLRFTYIQYAHLIGLEIIANSYFQVVESEATDMCRGKAESGLRTGRTLDLLTTHHPEHICGYQTMCTLSLIHIFHRQSYGGCKVGVGDVVIGATALAAEYNGVEKASAVKDKLIEMTHLNETLYCCGIACSSEGHATESGSYIIDLLLANVCKQNVTRFPYEIVRLAEDVAGGLMVTMPSEKDFNSETVVGRNGETIGDFCNKFFVGNGKCSTEDRARVMRFLENICLGSAAVGYRTESMHGAGSPQAQRIMIARQGNIQGKKELAKAIAGIK